MLAGQRAMQTIFSNIIKNIKEKTDVMATFRSGSRKGGRGADSAVCLEDRIIKAQENKEIVVAVFWFFFCRDERGSYSSTAINGGKMLIWNWGSIKNEAFALRQNREGFVKKLGRRFMNNTIVSLCNSTL